MRDQTKIPVASTDSKLIDEALEAMNADELRNLIRDIIPWLDKKTHARLASALINHAARNQSAWTPESPSQHRAAAVIEVCPNEAYRQQGSLLS